jgi:hypothetical protein
LFVTLLSGSEREIEEVRERQGIVKKPKGTPPKDDKVEGMKGRRTRMWLSSLILLVHVFTGLVEKTTGLVGRAPLLPENRWRPEAEAHKSRVLKILEEGFVHEPVQGPPDTSLPVRKNHHIQLPPSSARRAAKLALRDEAGRQGRPAGAKILKPHDDGFRKLNERHAVYNFLHEYYNIRGAKGTRRLGRWSPGLPRVTLQGATEEDLEKGILWNRGCTVHSEGVTYDAQEYFQDAEPSGASAFLWYHSLFASTARAEPILH